MHIMPCLLRNGLCTCLYANWTSSHPACSALVEDREALLSNARGYRSRRVLTVWG
jgi:hypothetical protein